jgi:hypothetical protein
MSILNIIKPKGLRYVQMIVDLFAVELFVHHDIFVEFLFELQMSMKKAYIKWPLIDMMEKNCK